MMNLLNVYPLPNLFPVLGHLLDWLTQSFGNIGIAVIVFTIIIKLALLPLDYWSRSGMKRNQLKLEKMRPQLEKLQKQYANDKMLYNQKMQSLYKKEGYSMMGSCLPTIVTLVMFMLVFNALNSYLKYDLISAYNDMIVAYQGVGEDATAWAAIADQYYTAFSPSFLWIDNLWLADVFWKDSVMTAAQFTTFTQIPVDAFLQYDPMMAPFQAGNGVNGFLILPILSGATSFVMQLVMSKGQKSQMELQGQNPATGKMLLYMMPIMMGVFAVSWNSAFAIYLVTSSLFSFVATLLINKIVDIRFRKEENEIAAAKVRR